MRIATIALANGASGNYAVHDPRIKQRHLKVAIHDYYFASRLKLVKPGGIVAFITSRYTPDKVNDEALDRGCDAQ